MDKVEKLNSFSKRDNPGQASGGVEKETGESLAVFGSKNIVISEFLDELELASAVLSRNDENIYDI